MYFLDFYLFAYLFAFLFAYLFTYLFALKRRNTYCIFSIYICLHRKYETLCAFSGSIFLQMAKIISAKAQKNIFAEESPVWNEFCQGETSRSPRYEGKWNISATDERKWNPLFCIEVKIQFEI